MANVHNKTALVTGGAGYIGSHCVDYLDKKGWNTVVVDNLSTGHRQAVLSGDFVEGDIGDPKLLDYVFSKYSIDVTLHFGASAYVGESVREPARYYRNNVVNGLNLLSSMVKHGVTDIVFSSTCAVYGDPLFIPLTEDHQKKPINPYGYTKMVFEQMALDLAVSDGLRPVFLRYFNAAGADDNGRLGEDHRPETHLIPLAIQTALGTRDEITIFGVDYPTDDGTCIRDFIHISDIADAHIKAMDYIKQGGAPTAFNLGNGQGYSVREVIQTVEKVSGRSVKTVEGARREGDPAKLVGSADKVHKSLGWEPRFKDLEHMVKTAYRWMETNPHGYGD